MGDVETKSGRRFANTRYGGGVLENRLGVRGCGSLWERPLWTLRCEMLAGLAEAATPGFGYGLLMGMLVSLLMSYLARLSMPMRTAGRRPAPGSQKVNGTDVASQYARPAASTPTVEPCPCSAAAEPPPALQRARAPTAEDRAAEPARRAVRLESAAIERLDRPPQLKVPCVPEAHEFEANDFVHSPLPLGLPDSAQPSEALRDAFGALLPMWSSEMGSAHFSSQPRAQQHGGDECGSAPQSGAPISSPRSMPPSSSSSPLKRRAGAAAPQPLPYTVASVPRRLDATSSKSLITARSAFAASSRAPSTTSEEAATGRPHSGGTLRRRVPAMSLARSRRSETPPANSSSCTGVSDTIHLSSMHNVFSSPNLSALGHGERCALATLPLRHLVRCISTYRAVLPSPGTSLRDGTLHASSWPSAERGHIPKGWGGRGGARGGGGHDRAAADSTRQARPIALLHDCHDR